jgi:hypothetical protein
MSINIKEAINFIKSPIGKFAVGILVVLVVGGIAARELFKNKQAENDVINNPAQQEQQINNPNNESSAISSANKNEQATPESKAEVLPTVESLKIDASLIDKPEELIKAFNDRETIWFNIGATHENTMAAFKHSGNLDSVAEEDADKYDKLFTDALFTKGWEDSNTALPKYAASMKALNSQTLSLYYRTDRPDLVPSDKEPYRRTASSSQIKQISRDTVDHSVTIKYLREDFDNADKNGVGEEMTSNESVVQGHGIETIVKFIVEDGSVKLVNIVL